MAGTDVDPGVRQLIVPGDGVGIARLERLEATQGDVHHTVQLVARGAGDPDVLGVVDDPYQPFRFGQRLEAGPGAPPMGVTLVDEFGGRDRRQLIRPREDRPALLGVVVLEG